MAINHAITIPSANNAPNPSGIPQIVGDDAPESPTPDNPWLCSFACTIPLCMSTITLLWDGVSFSLPDAEANDPEFGEVAFTYEPPLT